jgi:hypothetical protein
MFTNITNNEIIIFSFCIITTCFISQYIIKSFFYSTINETPQTFNFTHEQLNEIQDLLDRGDFIKSSKNCYPRKYPMRYVDEPISEYSNFDSDFLSKDYICNLIDKMELLNINCIVETGDIENIIP